MISRWAEEMGQTIKAKQCLGKQAILPEAPCPGKRRLSRHAPFSPESAKVSA
jgi:hypothetical protein